MKTLGKLQFKKLKRQLYFYNLKRAVNVNPLDHYLIFSDPRGGSTWLMEIVKQILGRPIIWEPLHLSKVPELKKIEFGWRQYIPENANWVEAKYFFDNLFAGKILNNWIMQQTSKKELIDANEFIIKFCRGNALLPYLISNYNFKNKPILMVRHPFAVVASQLKHGGWKDVKTDFVIPNTLFQYHYNQHKIFLDTLNTKVEVMVANWCITNQIPLSHPRNNKDWITITYESLLINPTETIERVLNEWNVTYDLNQIDFKNQSSTTLLSSPTSVLDRLHYWKESFTPEQISSMTRVLTYFDVKLYTSDLEPTVNYNNVK